MQPRVLDHWAEWLLHRRHGGDPALLRRQLEWLAPIRARVLENAAIGSEDVVLDVGAGDGLIAFAALDRLGPGGHVIFSDISQDLLDEARTLAVAAGNLDRCEFLCASAEDLTPLASESVDVVTTRSVLIYVANKRRALQEFHRVLRPGGRISLFEPINRFGHAAMFGTRFFGIPVGPVSDVWVKIRALYDRLQPPSDPMLDFDERDLFGLVEEMNFADVQMDYHAEVGPFPEKLVWERVLKSSGNPKIPSIEEAMVEALTASERDRFVDHFRPRLERGDARLRSAHVYVWATKASTGISA